MEGKTQQEPATYAQHLSPREEATHTVASQQPPTAHAGICLSKQKKYNTHCGAGAVRPACDDQLLCLDEHIVGVLELPHCNAIVLWWIGLDSDDKQADRQEAEGGRRVSTIYSYGGTLCEPEERFKSEPASCWPMAVTATRMCG